jgi:hypothetical protein
LPECPGTPRMSPATGAVNGNVYVLGGNTGTDNPTGTNCNVVDDWMYDPSANTWSRLQDMPVANGAFASTQAVFHDRYILMVGGYQYQNVIGPDGSIRPSYGTPSKHDPDCDYYSDVFVYDAVQNRFGAATMLPLNNCSPGIMIDGDTIHMIGNECEGAVVEGQPYDHVPALYLTGTITIAEPATSSMMVLLMLCGTLALLRRKRV